MLSMLADVNTACVQRHHPALPARGPHPRRRGPYLRAARDSLDPFMKQPGAEEVLLRYLCAVAIRPYVSALGLLQASFHE